VNRDVLEVNDHRLKSRKALIDIEGLHNESRGDGRMKEQDLALDSGIMANIFFQQRNSEVVKIIFLSPLRRVFVVRGSFRLTKLVNILRFRLDCRLLTIIPPLKCSSFFSADFLVLLTTVFEAP